MWTKTHTSSYFLSSVSLSKWALIGCSSNESAHRGLVKEWGRKAGISSHHPQMLQPDGCWLLLPLQNFLPAASVNFWATFWGNYISSRCCWSTSTECPKITWKLPSQQLAIELPPEGQQWLIGRGVAHQFAFFAQFIFIVDHLPCVQQCLQCLLNLYL